MKISVQEKISELERRIVVLEGKSPEPSPPKKSPNAPFPSYTGMSHWDEMWRHFRAMFGDHE